MSPRVLFINTVAGKGSVGRLVTGLSSCLKERGAETLIAYGRWDAPEGHDSYRIGSDLSVYLHGALSRITDRHGLYSAPATKALIRKTEEYDPDIIHLHNVHGYYVNYEILFDFLKNRYSGRKGRRIIWTLHDCWSFTGHCVHFEYAGCDRWKSDCHDCPEKGQYPKSVLFDASRENYRDKKKSFTGVRDLTLVTPSEWLKSKVRESYLKEYPVKCVPTGIDLSRFRKRPSSIREKYGVGDRPLLLGVANPWRERKGFDDFLKLSKTVGNEMRIAMIGLSPEQARTASSYVNIIPIIKTDSIEEMAEWYSESDIYVNLTYEDTFPTTNLEALSCGTPVITYRAGGSPESLTSSTGIIKEIGDITGVMDSVRKILQWDRSETEKACFDQAAKYGAELRFNQYINDVYQI
ncbi:MAG: glycosyltransferase [Lachnospiraceae bacterium]|nr:glycosyltransferase [Lachnospiraceae bacterium]